MGGAKTCHLSFARVHFAWWPKETSWEERQRVEVVIQSKFMWTARPAAMVTAKPIIYRMQGALAALSAVTDFRRRSLCEVNQSTATQPHWMLHCPSASLERDARLGVHVQTCHRFTTENVRGVEMSIVVKRINKERWVDVLFVRVWHHKSPQGQTMRHGEKLS